ncbi:ABC transporter substrate-binding protein [Brevundimonas sp.]|uniref:ABC transporter substrate-binding protein n=1 Tax=Brevundimonas sp. TaxID=1871086 RepID=UPI00289A455F|nr:ABC transporter substrate-binding protein [Brevundimonas sp.]
MSLSRRSLIGGLGFPALLPLTAQSRPRRIVSLNPCLDAILVEVANRDQIAAISHYSRIPRQSAIYDLAMRLPQTHGTAEEIIALRPDLVLSSRHGARATRTALERLGIPMALFDVPSTVEESISQVREVAAAAGFAHRGEALVSRIQEAINTARPDSPRRLKALVYQPNGFAAGHGTLMNEMMELAGFENVAGRYGIGKWGNVSVEHILANPPEVLLSGSLSPSVQTWSERIMRHPALASLSDRIVQTTLEEKLLYCGGPVLIQTAAALARAHRVALRLLP